MHEARLETHSAYAKQKHAENSNEQPWMGLQPSMVRHGKDFRGT
jgi:hypothetical protein